MPAPDPRIIPFARPKLTADEAFDTAERVLAIDAGTVADAASQGVGLMVCLMADGTAHAMLERSSGTVSVRRS